MEEALRALAESTRRRRAGKIFQPLRVALTGLTVSPGIFDVLVMLGRELALAANRCGSAIPEWRRQTSRARLVALLVRTVSRR